MATPSSGPLHDAVRKGAMNLPYTVVSDTDQVNWSDELEALHLSLIHI